MFFSELFVSKLRTWYPLLLNISVCIFLKQMQYNDTNQEFNIKMELVSTMQILFRLYLLSQ